ncbi:MAG: DUF3617 family protein [Gammaproteobacteria bacterium]|nr:DUF3617 family protein [Gammaproteobacteria bacterium]
MRSKCLIVAGVLVLIPFASGAAELEIKPGLWETTMTRTNPMTGEPTTETTTECVRETSFNPSEVMQDAEGCELVKEELDGDTLTFRMECNMQGSQTTVDGMFQTDSVSGKGNMDMNMDMGEMKMQMNMNWTSKRVGDC